MNDQSQMKVDVPMLPKGGGAIKSIGQGLGPVGTSGSASFALALPISAGRGFAPSLSLSYSSDVGNSLFGIGFSLSVNAITRRTSKGVPTYTDADDIVGPGGDVWMPERDDHGELITSEVSKYRDLELPTTYTVIRYHPRSEGAFALIQHWSSALDTPGFWLLHGADGSLHLFGKTTNSRRADPAVQEHVGVWLLSESLNLKGEHIVYEYKCEEKPSDPTQPRDYSAQRYLSKVHYGNFEADDRLYAWNDDGLNEVQWHFCLVFDYGERTTEYARMPGYTEPEGASWLEREDPFTNFAYGFELSTRRLCRQVLMFHHFPEEPAMGPDRVLVQRLLLEYRQTPLSYNQLEAAHHQAYDAKGKMQSRPPMEFTFIPFGLNPDPGGYQPFDAMPGLNDGQSYQLVDINGDGVPGILFQSDNAWYYREPLRAQLPCHPDEVTYGEWQVLQQIPLADSRKPVRQSLIDINGDGRLDWLIAAPGASGYFTRNPEQTWSTYIPVEAMPVEFFHPMAQMADLVGAGLSDLALIGPRSVRLYAHRRQDGFSSGVDVLRKEGDDDLPQLRDSRTELVAFSDVLGSGQQHLIRIRHNEVKCWPNLGRGQFGKGFVFAPLDFAYEQFDASRIRLADLDGSGAVDLIYLESTHAQIFMNRCGNGLETTSVKLPWPNDVRYDRLCQVSFADLQGLGCSSLILTVPYMSPRHWRYDFAQSKPYLLSSTNNNMGAASSVTYRGSPQVWLDEKQRLMAENKPAVSYLPFPVHVVSRQTQVDEITGNRRSQHFDYKGGYYDSIERGFRGFAVLLATDAETPVDQPLKEGYTAPVLTRTRFHTGQYPDIHEDDDFNHDGEALKLKGHLYSRYRHQTEEDDVRLPTPDEAQEMSRALVGSTLSVEVYAAADYAANPKTARPYSVQRTRYLVRELRGLTPQVSPPQPYSVMLPLILESISYQYEPFADAPEHFDPLCQHTINLSWDRKGQLTHGVTINHARRKDENDPPPFNDEFQSQWWKDAHDDAQLAHYLSESRVQYIHLDQPQNWQGWRLALPYRQRSNALVLKKKDTPADFIFCWEAFGEESPFNPLDPQNATVERMLAGLSIQRYKDARTGQTLADGTADFDALHDYTETAELDGVALKAYDILPPEDRPDDATFKAIGYHEMQAFWPAGEPIKLWSVKRGFTQHETLEKFYVLQTFQQTLSHGVTRLEFDRYCLQVNSVELPDKCKTRVEDIDYRTLQPARIVDPNENVQEACYGAFGQLFATSFHGTEWDASTDAAQPVGFDPIADYQRPVDDSPAWAIEHKKEALLNAATALFEDAFSWMGKIAQPEMQNPDWLKQWVAQGDLLMPHYHIRASARTRLEHLQDGSDEDHALLALIVAARRQPVDIVTLQADQYPYAPEDEKQIRCVIACGDGVGRQLQIKQEVAPGMAYVVGENGDLVLDENGDPLVAEALRRWRVSQRVELNNKGLVIREYRPYFADGYRYINDESLRQKGYHDKQFYDPLGRPTETWRADGSMRRLTYCGWFHYLEDENDTAEEVQARKTSHQDGVR